MYCKSWDIEKKGWKLKVWDLVRPLEGIPTECSKYRGDIQRRRRAEGSRTHGAVTRNRT